MFYLRERKEGFETALEHFPPGYDPEKANKLRPELSGKLTVLDCLLAARAQAIRTLKAKYGDEFEETTLLSKLMAYCSKEAHSCVEKAAMIGFVKLRILEPDQNCSLRGLSLRRAMEEDIQNGLYPFFVSTTLGTTGCCAFDNLQEIGNSRIFSIFWLSLLIISTVFINQQKMSH